MNFQKTDQDIKTMKKAGEICAQALKKVLDEIGRLVSTKAIDKWYKTARENGAEGGKIVGAGGGGFLFLYAKRKYHDRIRRSLKSLEAIDFSFEPQGSKIIFVS